MSSGIIHCCGSISYGVRWDWRCEFSLMIQIARLDHWVLTVQDREITCQFYLRDPDGNLIELARPLSAEARQL
ncbi:MAG: hypothetical protein ICV77_12610 [Cyanobacteria bacterium Co-bin8]|nr:hypothetical protein [Cyanobacteria bacterium Co-bin8]